MSIVFMVFGIAAVVVTWGLGLVHEHAHHQNDRRTRVAAFLMSMISAGLAIIFLFSAGIAWVQP